MYLYRILAIASIMSLVIIPMASAQMRRPSNPPPVMLSVDTTGMSHREIQDLRCLSLNVYYEARGTRFNNQLAVALVVRNRQIQSGRSACQVIYAPGQFTWTQQSKKPPAERDSWMLAQRIAMIVSRADGLEDITRGATHFHENRVRPGWSHRAKTTVRIGAHTFHRIEEVAEARD